MASCTMDFSRKAFSFLDDSAPALQVDSAVEFFDEAVTKDAVALASFSSATTVKISASAPSVIGWRTS